MGDVKDPDQHQEGQIAGRWGSGMAREWVQPRERCKRRELSVVWAKGLTIHRSRWKNMCPKEMGELQKFNQTGHNLWQGMLTFDFGEE